MPMIIVSGYLLMFPETAPNEIFGMGGVWPMALLHIVTGYFLSLFMFGHIYLGTTGHTAGELFKSMIDGWHLSEEHEARHEAEISPRLIPVTEGGKRFFPHVFYNPITITGSLLAIVCFVCILFLIVFEYFSEGASPYTGIIAFVVLPTFLIFGVLTVAFGIFKENRNLLSKSSKKRGLPIIDLNNPKHQLATLVFTVGIFVLITMSVFSSFKAYEYTDSDEFCGKVCHKVLEPTFNAYQESAHSRVGCVKCHISSTEKWFVKSKLSGLYQVYSVMFNKYSKPIPTPIKNLRPSAQTCVECHWPKQFYHENTIKYDFFTSDEANSHYKIKMTVKIGGGSEDIENNSGIHWVMNLSNEVTYLALDKERMNIPWVKSRSLETGKETIYRRIDTKVSDEMLIPENFRKMDCMDCHNRPSHIYNQPNKTINAYMLAGRIDPTLPYIKNLAVQAVETYATDKINAMKDIGTFIWDYYKRSYPDIFKTKRNSISQSIIQINKIYQRNYYPEMNADWKSFPNHLGHMYSPGCFRCHDGKHVSDDGKVISNDCNVCHLIISQQPPNEPMQESATGMKFIHPGGIDKLLGANKCYECHGKYPTKRKINVIAKKN